MTDPYKKNDPVQNNFLERVEDLYKYMKPPQLKMIQAMVAEGMDVNYREYADSDSALSIVARARDTESLAFILENGGNVNFQNAFGLSLLMLASVGEQFDVMDILFKAGADMEIRNSSDQDVFEFVLGRATKEHAKVLRVLNVEAKRRLDVVLTDEQRRREEFANNAIKLKEDLPIRKFGGFKKQSSKKNP